MVATPTARAARAWASSCTSTQAKKPTANSSDHPRAAAPDSAGAHSSRLRATTTPSPTNHDRSSRTGTPSTRPSPTPRLRLRLPKGHSSSSPRPLAQEVA
jgi:hypothetical protein